MLQYQTNMWYLSDLNKLTPIHHEIIKSTYKNHIARFFDNFRGKKKLFQIPEIFILFSENCKIFVVVSSDGFNYIMIE